MNRANRIAPYSLKSLNNTQWLVMGLALAMGVMLIVFGGICNLLAVPNPLKSILVTILLGFGISFTSSATISLIMLSAGFMDLIESAQRLARVVGNELHIPCAERFALVESAEKLGLSRAYPSRREALSRSGFYDILLQECDQIFVVGSSMLGLLQDRHFGMVLELLEKKLSEGVEVKFMLTHPLFADFRAAQEGRNSNDIGREVVKSLRILKTMANSGKVSVMLYRGTPTCFGICASAGMLINPYPYGRQAYESPCFELHSGSAAYNFYRQAHFQTQFGGKIESLELNDGTIKNLEDQLQDFARRVEKFESLERTG